MRVHVRRSSERGKEEQDDGVADANEEGDSAGVETAEAFDAAIDGIEDGAEDAGLMLLWAQEESR